MATQLASQGLSASIGWDYEAIIAGLANSAQIGSFRFTPTQFTQGTGAGQCDRLYASQQTIAASGSFSITLTNFVDFFGNTVSMLRWKAIFILLASGGASSIAIGNATNPLVLFSTTTATEKINSGGVKMTVHPVDATGIAIVGGTSDQLKVLNNDGSNAAVVSICVFGCSA